MLRLQPVEVVSAEALQLPLWGGLGEEDRLRARRALVRVQGLLGPEAVQMPVLSGGRGPAERITLVPLGDELVPRADPRQPWPGQLPSRRRLCSSTIQWNCLTPKAIRCE